MLELTGEIWRVFQKKKVWNCQLQNPKEKHTFLVLLGEKEKKKANQLNLAREKKVYCQLGTGKVV